MSSTSRLAPFLLPLLFTILTVAIGAVTWRFHAAQKEVLDRALDAQLTTTADAKVRQLVEWRREHLGQANVIASGIFATSAIEHAIAGSASRAEREGLQERLRAICTHLRYAGAILVDLSGRPVLWEGRRFGNTAHLRAVMEAVLRAGDVVERDYDATDLNHPAHLGISIPLRNGPGQPIFGGLLLSIDPESYMEPLLEWPVPSRTADINLVRREGDSVLFLSATRSPSAGPLRQRVEMSRTDTVEVMAATGSLGTVRGVDYRGVPVFAALRPVPGTAWLLIAKIDEQEAAELLRRRSLLLGVTAVSLILTAGALLLFLWRREQLQQYRARYEVETANRHLAERNNLLSRMTNDVIVLLDEKGNILTANDRVSSVYGYSPDEIQGWHVCRLRAEQSVAEFDGQWIQARERGSLIFETVHRRRDGTEFPVEVSTRTIHIEGKGLEQSIIRDISDRKRAERELSESESRFRQVVESSPYAILVVDAAGVLYANPEAVRLFGAKAESDLSGRPLLDRIAPEQRAEVEQRVAASLSGLPLSQVERRYLRMNGELFWASVTATRSVYAGRPAVLLFIRDITEARAAEEERARLEEQLRHAVKMESVGRLAGGVAHDFNNYLTVINGYCDMLLEGPVADGATRECLEEIRAAGERAASVTQQLLTFSRKQIASTRVIDLNQVVIGSDQLLRRLIGEDIEMRSLLHPGRVTVLADPVQIGQVLMNLVVNARDAMPEGGSIAIETQHRDVETGGDSHPDIAPGAYAVLSVTDSGTGISSEIQARIFEPFFTTKSVGAGTGLGLSTAYGIARQSGGWLAVQSKPGEGARFEVWLPRVEPAAEDGAGVDPGKTPVRGNETLLVVEDQADVRRLTLSMLKSAGYHLLEASNGEEALKVSAAHPGKIDLLLTDVIMPGLNGRQLAERLTTERPDLKILYMSGYTSDVIGRGGCVEPGFEYLRKPFGAAELCAKIREVLERRTEPRGRILVIDDDASVRGLIRHVLHQAGHSVVEAADGKAGMAEIAKQAVDLVITDLVMPEQEGLELLRRLHEQRPELPVIVISGAFDGAFLKVASLLGAAATLSKPLDSETLLRTVQVVMNARGAEKDADSQT